MIKRWHILISGFTQREDAAVGCEALWLRLVALQDRETVAVFKEWNDDFEALAAKIERCSVADPVVTVAAYSWGAGQGFVSLARALDARGLRIRCATLADPVYYSRIPLWLARFAGAVSGKAITVPPNVGSVQSFVQKTDYPRGSELVGTAGLAVARPVLVAATHAEMDDLPEWHDAAVGAARMHSNA